jgi:hypothetical protein
MPTWFYADGCARVEDLIATNLEGFVARTLPYPGAPVKSPYPGKSYRASSGNIGSGNNEPVVMTEIISEQPLRRTVPLLIIFLTDGGISRSDEIIAILRKISYAPIFWQFVGVGNADYGVLRKLDTVSGRAVDNAGFFSVDDLSHITDDELYDRILSEFPAWLKAIRAARILR